MAAVTDLGDGHRQPRPDGDGYPEVYLTSQGDNKLQTLADGATRPTYRDIALKSGVIAHARSGGDTLPSTAWHPEFDDVNNDCLSTCSSQGQRRREARLRGGGSEQPVHRPTDGTFVEGAEAAGILSFDRHAGPRLSTSTSTGCSTSSRSTAARREAMAQRRPWRRRTPGADGQLDRPAIQQSAPNLDAIGAWSRYESASAPSPARSPPAAATRAARSVGSMPVSVRPIGPRSVFNGQTARPDRG